MMHIVKDRFGEDVVVYDSPEEMVAAVRNFLCGNLAALTCEEVLLLRSCEEDPNNVRWEADHAGVMSEEVDELDVNGLVFIFDLGRTFEEGKQLLLKKIGPHPITCLALWEIEREMEREMIEPQVASRLAACDRFKMSSTRAVGPATFWNRSRYARNTSAAQTATDFKTSPEAKRREATTF